MELWQIGYIWFMLTLAVGILTFRNGHNKGYRAGRDASLIDGAKSGHFECLIFYQRPPGGFKDWQAFTDASVKRPLADSGVVKLSDYRK